MFVYEVKYTVFHGLFKNGKIQKDTVQDLNGECSLNVVGDSEARDVIPKAEKIVRRQERPFPDTDENGKNIKGTKWKCVRFQLNSVIQKQEVHL